MIDWKEGLQLLPSHMHDAVERYILYGIEGGSFLNAVMSNDFKEVVGRADTTNLAFLKTWAEYIYWYAPSECQGSRAKVVAWIARGGLMGRERQIDDVTDAEEALHEAEQSITDSEEVNGNEEA